VRRVALALALVVAGCVEPPVVDSGKTCTAACSPGYSCEAGRCLKQGHPVCELFPGAAACFDFETGGLPDGGVQQQNTGSLGIDDGRSRYGSRSLHAMIPGDDNSVQRLDLALPVGWKRVRASFDVFPAVQPLGTEGHISLGEVLCHPGTQFSGLWLFYEADQGPARFAAKTDQSNEKVLMPQLELARWTRVTLEVGRDPLTGTVTVDGVPAATLPLVDCGGAWSVVLGLAGPTNAAGDAWYDDVVLEVER
jgi:hypothetical protein